MGDRKLTFGGGEYWDRSLYLIDGSVKPEGIEIDFHVHGATELFRKVAQEAAFDAAEMSMSTYLALFSRDDRRFVGIPVFPSRNFRHCCMFVNTRAGIEPNRKVLETLIEYLVEQGLATRKVALEELFAEEFSSPRLPEATPQDPIHRARIQQ